jgi:PAS domain S-box-containing protein
MAFLQGGNFTIRYANPAFHLLLEKSKQKLIGDSLNHALPGSSECLSILERVNRTGRAETYIGQEHFPSHPLYFSYVAWPVLAAGGRRLGLMLQVTETTSFHSQTIAMNEALMLGSVRQHELIESAETLNAQLQVEILRRQQVEEEIKIQGLAIKASEQRYRGLIEAIPQIVWTATPEGALDFANKRWFEYLEIDLDTFNQTGWLTVLHPDDTDRTLEAWASGLKSESAFQIEHRLRNSSTGSFRWHLSHAVPICTEEGRVTQWFGTSTDLEDQKRAELAVFNKQKLESLGLLQIHFQQKTVICRILGQQNPKRPGRRSFHRNLVSRW